MKIFNKLFKKKLSIPCLLDYIDKPLKDDPQISLVLKFVQYINDKKAVYQFTLIKHFTLKADCQASMLIVLTVDQMLEINNDIEEFVNKYLGDPKSMIERVMERSGVIDDE